MLLASRGLDRTESSPKESDPVEVLRSLLLLPTRFTTAGAERTTEAEQIHGERPLLALFPALGSNRIAIRRLILTTS